MRINTRMMVRVMTGMCRVEGKKGRHLDDEHLPGLGAEAVASDPAQPGLSDGRREGREELLDVRSQGPDDRATRGLLDLLRAEGFEVLRFLSVGNDLGEQVSEENQGEVSGRGSEREEGRIGGRGKGERLVGRGGNETETHTYL